MKMCTLPDDLTGLRFENTSGHKCVITKWNPNVQMWEGVNETKEMDFKLPVKKLRDAIEQPDGDESGVQYHFLGWDEELRKEFHLISEQNQCPREVIVV